MGPFEIASNYMTTAAYNAINGVGEDYATDNPKGFKNLIDHYGTHVVLQARLGGRIRHSMEIDISKISTEYDLEAFASAAYDGIFVEANADVEDKFKQSYKENQSKIYTEINEEEFSIELKQGSSFIPIEIKSNSAWKIYFSFDDERFCFAYPHGGVGDATVDFCVNKNLSDERCTGKMYISFKEGSTKSKIVHLSQKGNIDNDENFEYEEWDYYHFECPWCGNDIPILWDDLLDSEKQDSIITCNLCELFEKTIHEVLWAKHGWDDL